MEGRGNPASGAPSPIPSGSPRPGTASPLAPSGLTARVVAGTNGTYYLVENDTGLRIDVIDDENVRTPEELFRTRAGHVSTAGESGLTLSEESDLAEIPESDTAGQSTAPTRSAENKLDELLTAVGAEALSRKQAHTLNQIRGSLSTGRS
jgi:hypothetical protein